MVSTASFNAVLFPIVCSAIQFQRVPSSIDISMFFCMTCSWFMFLFIILSVSVNKSMTNWLKSFLFKYTGKSDLIEHLSFQNFVYDKPILRCIPCISLSCLMPILLPKYFYKCTCPIFILFIFMVSLRTGYIMPLIG